MDNLLKTLRDAVEMAMNKCHRDYPTEDFEQLLSLLSTPDALAWALLEEMAGRDVESTTGIADHTWFRVREKRDGWVRLQKNGAIDVLPTPATVVEWKEAILCLARALQEQRRRESEVGDA